MDYIEKTLADSETVLYRARFHPLIAIGGWSAFVALALVAAYFASQSFVAGAVFTLLIAAGVLAMIMYPVWSRDIAITNQRIIASRGVFSRATEELQLDAIEEARVEQSFLGRMLNYGKVIVTGRGERVIQLPEALHDPVEIRQQLQNAMASNAAAPAAPAAPAVHPSGSETVVVDPTEPRRARA